MHASGTSGPIAPRDDGAFFLTAAKTNKGSVRQCMILFQHRIRRNEQTVSVGAENVSMTPIRRKAYFFSFSTFKNFLDI